MHDDNASLAELRGRVHELPSPDAYLQIIKLAHEQWEHEPEAWTRIWAPYLREHLSRVTPPPVTADWDPSSGALFLRLEDPLIPFYPMDEWLWVQCVSDPAPGWLELVWSLKVPYDAEASARATFLKRLEEGRFAGLRHLYLHRAEIGPEGARRLAAARGCEQRRGEELLEHAGRDHPHLPTPHERWTGQSSSATRVRRDYSRLCACAR